MAYYKTLQERKLRQEIVEMGRRLWQRGFVAANDGNISARLDENVLLTTPTGVSKGFMTPEMLLRVDMEGNVLSRDTALRPSSELKMHFEVYRQREDVAAVVHAHPPYSTAFAVAGIPLDQCALAEAVFTLGSVPIAPYATPSTQGIPESIRPLVQHSDAILLANHGALTLGTEVLTAYFRMETLEHAAQIIFLSRQLGQTETLSPEEVEKLMVLREKAGVPGRITPCRTQPDSVQSGELEAVVREITRAVLERLRTGKGEE